MLIYAGPLGEIARQRLKIIFENTDGFEIARQDLQIRGPGEFVGARQSGVPLLRYADLELDADLVEMARGGGRDDAEGASRIGREALAAVARLAGRVAEVLTSEARRRRALRRSQDALG